MATLRVTGQRCVFITLTFAADVPRADAQTALRRLFERLRRAYPQMSALWRFERQQRGAPHFHLICFGLPYIPQRELQALWEQCTRETLSIVHITLVRSKRMAMGYVSKYVAKREQRPASASFINSAYPHAEEETSEGRAWGIHNRQFLPYAPREMLLISDTETERYLTWAVEAWTRKRVSFDRDSVGVFINDASDVLRWAEEHCALAWPEYDEASFTGKLLAILCFESAQTMSARST